MERRSPGSALSNQSAPGREQEAVGQSPAQGDAHSRGRFPETGRWVIWGGIICAKSAVLHFFINAFFLQFYNN